MSAGSAGVSQFLRANHDSFSNYGGVSVNASWSHEAALRLVLNSLSTAAARYGRYITPLLSFSIDFYIRVFVRVDSRATEVKRLARSVFMPFRPGRVKLTIYSQTGIVFSCHFCHSFYTQPFGRVVEKETNKGAPVLSYKTAPAPTVDGSGCPECGSTLHVSCVPHPDLCPAEVLSAWRTNVARTTPRHHLCAASPQEHRGAGERVRDVDTYTRNAQPRRECQCDCIPNRFALDIPGSADRYQELETPFYLTTNKMFGTCHSSSAATTKVVCVPPTPHP